jgi:hypothetical protein
MKKITNLENNSVFSTFKIVVQTSVLQYSGYRNNEIDLYPEDGVSVVLRNDDTCQFSRLYITEGLNVNI